MAHETAAAYAAAFGHAREAMGMAQPVEGVVEGGIGASAANLPALRRAMDRARRACGVVGFVGGPPCPDFSVGGKQAGRHGERGRLTEEYVRLAVDAAPDFFVLENVKGLVSTAKHRAFFNEMLRHLSKGGFHVTHRLVNAIHYGAPQDRWRVVTVGFRDASFPPTAAEAMAAGFGWEDGVWDWGADPLTMPWPQTGPFGAAGGDAPPDGPPPELTVQWWFEKNRVAAHDNAVHFAPRGAAARMSEIAEGDVSRKSFKRLHRWRYSPTVAYGNNEVHLHPREPRRLTAAEAMALQTVPRRFVLPPEMTLTDMFKSVGNGVPYLLSRAVANAVAAALAAHGAGGAAAASARA